MSIVIGLKCLGDSGAAKLCPELRDYDLDYRYRIEIVDGVATWGINCRHTTPVFVKVSYSFSPTRNWPSKGKKPFEGALVGHRLTDAEAEVITGLSMPAAMDRLTELVYESSNPFSEV